MRTKYQYNISPFRTTQIESLPTFKLIPEYDVIQTKSRKVSNRKPPSLCLSYRTHQGHIDCVFAFYPDGLCEITTENTNTKMLKY